VTAATARSERGDTLIEVLVSVVILGLAITAFLLGMSTNIGSSSLGRDQANVEAMLTSAGAVIQDSNLNPYTCNAPKLTYQTNLTNAIAPPRFAMLLVTRVAYWDPIAEGWTGTCPALQGITVQAQSADRQVTMVRQFGKAPTP
jgi:prepilin-type N-terminal cleavage/methylation domain-containing protein